MLTTFICQKSHSCQNNDANCLIVDECIMLVLGLGLITFDDHTFDISIRHTLKIFSKKYASNEVTTGIFSTTVGELYGSEKSLFNGTWHPSVVLKCNLILLNQLNF